MQPSARIRPCHALASDMAYVLSLEPHEANLPFVAPCERTQHEAWIRFPDKRHFITEGGASLEFSA